MLADIEGKPLIIRVWDNAKKSELIKKIFIATDNEKIVNVCEEFGAECILTPTDIPSGTDRIAKVLELTGDSSSIVVNIQGDEPLLSANTLDEMLEAFLKTNAEVGTLMSKIKTNEELENPSVVKVVPGLESMALYFSRQAVPYLRDIPGKNWLENHNFYRHIGVYAYRRNALLDFVRFSQSKLEKAEKLEQLRLLERGYKYYCHETTEELISVDTGEDLKKVREIYSRVRS